MILEVKDNKSGQRRKFNLDSTTLSGDLAGDGLKLYPNYDFWMYRNENEITFVAKGSNYIRADFRSLGGRETLSVVADRIGLKHGEVEIGDLRVRVHP